MKEIKLFDYQEDMKERIEKALRLHRSVMAQMPTGTGKTVLLASVVESFLREHSNCNVWIVAHRRELVSQIKDTLNKFLLNFSFSNHPVPLSKEGSTSTPSPSSSEGGDVTALRCSEPLRSKVGGPKRSSPWLCGMGPPGEGSLKLIVYSWSCSNLLITCRFLAFFLVVSRKKRNFGGI